MPFGFSFKAHKQYAKYDLQARAGSPNSTSDGRLGRVDMDDHMTDADESNTNSISILPYDNYMPELATAKSFGSDMIQLTKFKNRRPTIQDDRPLRKPSMRNIFLGVPQPEKRRFSEDIRGASLAAKCAALQNKETKRVLILQVFIPFLLSGFGNVGAGLFLNYAQTWQVFRADTIFYMLLATVMAFKTNLEATLAARLSTCSNMGTMSTWKKRLEAFIGNLALVQTQSVIFGFMSGALVVLISSLEHGHFDMTLSLRVMATSMAAITVNEVVSSVLILSVVVISERAGVNPDNVSTLIAAMFGDFSSVFFVSVTAALFYMIQTLQWVFIVIIVVLSCLLPATAYLATHNSFTKGMFLGTHLPLALAVTVATLSGMVFDHAVQSFARIAIYQAVVNGVSVNLMAVQASRISTYLQQLSNVAPERAREFANKCNPVEALYAQDMNASVARWLIAMCVPAMSTYLCFIFLVSPSHVDITIYLIICCLVSIIAQVTFIQCLTYLVTPISWKMDWDPDNVVIPVLMSISDCSGNAILLTAFLFLQHMHDPNSIGQPVLD